MRLVDLLNTWADGKAYKGVKTPPLETMQEFADIYSGSQKTTINSSVVQILDLCGINYRVKGIGWEVI